MTNEIFAISPCVATNRSIEHFTDKLINSPLRHQRFQQRLQELLLPYQDNPDFPKIPNEVLYNSESKNLVTFIENNAKNIPDILMKIIKQADYETCVIKDLQALNFIVERMKNSIQICIDTTSMNYLEQLAIKIENAINGLENYKSLLNTPEQLLITEAVTVLTTSLEKVKKTTTSDSSVTT